MGQDREGTGSRETRKGEGEGASPRRGKGGGGNQQVVLGGEGETRKGQTPKESPHQPLAQSSQQGP